MFGRTSLLVIFFSFLVSHSNAQSRLYAGLIENNGQWHWSIDLTDLGDNDVVLIQLKDSSSFTRWEELAETRLTSLFEYAAPRFQERTDTFDCYTRHLLSLDNEHQDTAGGKNLGIPGRRKPGKAPARGQGDLLISGSWKNEKYIMSVALSEIPATTSRVLCFTGPAGEYPVFKRVNNMDTLSPALHLFTVNDHLQFAIPGEVTHSGMDLPLEINDNRRSFLDTWKGVLERNSSPGLMYAWDLGSDGGNKCEPCPAEPPSVTLLIRLGAGELSAHRYFTYHLIPGNATWHLEEKTGAGHQVLFTFRLPSKGFLDCPEGQNYLLKLDDKRRQEEENLKILIGSEAAYFLTKKE